VAQDVAQIEMNPAHRGADSAKHPHASNHYKQIEQQITTKYHYLFAVEFEHVPPPQIGFNEISVDSPSFFNFKFRANAGCGFNGFRGRKCRLFLQDSFRG